ncbi:hypothetical protein PYCC9005_005932 [Savitreella phatthalungensis]
MHCPSPDSPHPDRAAVEVMTYQHMPIAAALMGADGSFQLTFGREVSIDRGWQLVFKLEKDTTGTDVRCGEIEPQELRSMPTMTSDFDFEWISYRLFSNSNAWTDSKGGGSAHDRDTECWRFSKDFRMVKDRVRTLVKPPGRKPAIVEVKLHQNRIVVSAAPHVECKNPSLERSAIDESEKACTDLLSDIGIMVWFKLLEVPREHKYIIITSKVEMERSLPYYAANQASEENPCRRVQVRSLKIGGCTFNLGMCNGRHAELHKHDGFDQVVDREYHWMTTHVNEYVFAKSQHFAGTLCADYAFWNDELLELILRARATEEL